MSFHYTWQNVRAQILVYSIYLQVIYRSIKWFIIEVPGLLNYCGINDVIVIMLA